MTTRIIMNRQDNTLTLEFHHTQNFLGTLVVPFSNMFGAQAYESVHCQVTGEKLHSKFFDADCLGDTSDLNPYLEAMTNSMVRRRGRAA